MLFRNSRQVIKSPGRINGGLLVAAALALGATAAGTLPTHAATAPGSAAARFTAAANPSQNEVLESALTGHPGGTRVSPSAVTWKENGISVTLKVNTTTTAAGTNYGNCPAGDFCVWDKPGFKASNLRCELMLASSFHYGGTSWVDWAGYSDIQCGRAGTWS